MKISPETWKKVEPLLTTALDMGVAERTSWLAGLHETHPDVAPVVARMLATHERAERAREMETVPRLAPAPPASSAFSPGERVGPFRLLRPIGRGGMGEVWLAEQADGRVNRQVAIKLPASLEASEIRAERFQRERDILARLAHPHIARLYDAGASDAGQPYLAMEFVEGESLDAYMAARKLPLPARLALFRQVLAAVAHAHRHLVVHRDLKPANILIDASGQVKLLDFGIARLVEDGPAAGAATGRDLTRAGGRLMTLRYAAPEQVGGGSITTATDVYSLGVILHEMATGASPYAALRAGRPLTEAMLPVEEIAVPSALALSAQAAHERGLAGAGSLSRALSGDLDAIVLKALRRDPADRYASVELFDADIRAHLEKRPVKARAGTWRYLAGRFAARHRLPLGFAAAALGVLATSLVMIERERRVAVAERARAERHFASVRKLANTFIFDVHAQIETLAGSLKAREMLVKTSLDYLDALSAEAGGDPALLFELASAYRNIGNIQGQPGSANTGAVTAAVANFVKAKRLFVELDRVRPDDIAVLREHASLSYALARTWFVTADPRWQEEIAATVGLTERVAALPGATPRDRARVAGAMAEQAHLSSLMGGQTAANEAAVTRAVEILEALLREAPGQAGVRANLVSTYQRAADILTGSKRTVPGTRLAIAYHRKALDLLREGLASQPDDERLRKITVENLVGLADALSLAGDLREADRTAGEALAASAALLSRDPGNAQVVSDRVAALGKAALVAHRLGDPPRAIRLSREALALAAKLPADTRRTRDARSRIAEAKSTLGFALLASAGPANADRARRLAQLGEARAMLADSLDFLGEVRAEKLGVYPESEEAEIVAALRRCDEEAARLQATRISRSRP